MPGNTVWVSASAMNAKRRSTTCTPITPPTMPSSTASIRARCMNPEWNGSVRMRTARPSDQCSWATMAPSPTSASAFGP